MIEKPILASLTTTAPHLPRTLRTNPQPACHNCYREVRYSKQSDKGNITGVLSCLSAYSQELVGVVDNQQDCAVGLIKGRGDTGYGGTLFLRDAPVRCRR